MVETTCKVGLEIFIEFKRDSSIDSNIDSLIIRLENEKLNKSEMVLFEYNFQGEFSSEEIYLKISNLV